MDNIFTIFQLQAYLAKQSNVPTDYKIAVGSLIFTSDNRVILIERGKKSRDAQGKLEGVGGGIEEGETDLVKALQREINEELGNIEVEVIKPYSIQILPGESYAYWVVVNYVCRLKSGNPVNQEPDKINSIHYFTLDKIDDNHLSMYQREAFKDYRQQFGDKPFGKLRI